MQLIVVDTIPSTVDYKPERARILMQIRCFLFVRFCIVVTCEQLLLIALSFIRLAFSPNGCLMARTVLVGVTFNLSLVCMWKAFTDSLQ